MSNENGTPLVYCVNYNDHDRRNKMTCRFQELDIPYHFVEPVYKTDKRLDHPEINKQHKRTYSIMLQHLDSLQHFLNNTDEESGPLCIICEDDIMLSTKIKEKLPEIMSKFVEMDLDLLLMGYLWPQKIDPYSNGHFPLLIKTQNFVFTEYPDDLWGSQLYMASRKHAQYLINTFPPEYIFQNPADNLPYNPDWIITKVGRRALISPMLAVEEGATKTDNDGQNEFHRKCFLANYIEGEFV